MAIRSSGLGYTFTALLTAQILFLGTLVGLTGKLAAAINKAAAPGQPAAVVLSLVVGTIGGLVALLILALHLTAKLIRYLPTVFVESIFLILLVVTSVLLGKPLTGLDCAKVGQLNHLIDNLQDVYSIPPGELTADLGRLFTSREKLFPFYDRTNSPGKGVIGLAGLNGEPGDKHALEQAKQAMGDYKQWVGRVDDYCVRMKVSFGMAMGCLVLALAIAVAAGLLWKRGKEIPEIEEGEWDGGYTAGVGEGQTGPGVQFPTRIPEGYRKNSKVDSALEDNPEKPDLQGRSSIGMSYGADLAGADTGYRSLA
ncbi:hypothetical protein BDZ91DRAFT_799309 [Kalaharituber pfeilii]|nr:hypothetical protein BDZ91DRAFT_799309 [Kalaharituber pfeilii]